MGHEKRIVAAFVENEIKQILVIDDVYDAPVLSEISGDLLDYLEDIEGVNACTDAGIADDVLTAAIAAATDNNVDSEELNSVVEALYQRFVETREKRYDPGTRFETVKGATLSVLEPLVTLLKKCGPDVQVHRAGIGNGATRFKELNPQVVFLDYYLSADAVGGGLTTAIKNKARKASVNLLTRMLAESDNEAPAIVLMSSEQVKTEAQGFRESVEKQGAKVLALRFRFLQKDWISVQGADLKIDNEAADALLDTSQGYVFGQVLQLALQQWRTGAENALQALLGEIRKLEPKDFAYLFRFRLAAEGERMGDYLEWLFGESLRALAAENVEWKSEIFKRLDDPALSKGLEGAFDGPSAPIAKIFHRIRVDEHLPKTRDRHALGDLFVNPKDKALWVVITPDCDLVPRKGKTKVERVLTMAGELRSFEDESSSADQFIIYKGKPFSVRWNPKKLMTYPVSGTGSLGNIKGLDFVGTLRPLYAQEVQRLALTDLSRIGLAVAPIMGVDASVEVYIRKSAGKGDKFETLAVEGKAMATVLPERGDTSLGHKVLLRRSFVHHLVDALRAIDSNTLTDEDKPKLSEFLKDKNEDQLINGFLIKGASVKSKGPLGTSITIGAQPEQKKDAPWLQLILKLSDEAMEELAHIDPTIALPEEKEPGGEAAA